MVAAVLEELLTRFRVHFEFIRHQYDRLHCARIFFTKGQIQRLSQFILLRVVASFVLIFWALPKVFTRHTPSLCTDFVRFLNHLKLESFYISCSYDLYLFFSNKICTFYKSIPEYSLIFGFGECSYFWQYGSEKKFTNGNTNGHKLFN